jgi:hypothetical protein
MGRRKGTLNRMDLRDQHDAAERRATDETEAETEEEEAEDEDEEEEDEEEGEEEEGAEAEADEEEEGGLDEDEEPRPKKKKKKAKPVAEEKPKTTRSRSRAAKIVRQRLIWGVFNNSNQRVATFEYPKRAEAEKHAAKLSEDKKSTFFVQPVKEPIVEKKEEKEKEKKEKEKA